MVDSLGRFDVVQEFPVDHRLAGSGDRRQQNDARAGSQPGSAARQLPANAHGPLAHLLRRCGSERPAGRARDGRRRCRPNRAAPAVRPCRGNCRDGNRRAPACPAVRTMRSRQNAAAGRQRSDRACRIVRGSSPRVRSTTAAIASVSAAPRQSGSPIARSARRGRSMTPADRPAAHHVEKPRQRRLVQVLARDLGEQDTAAIMPEQFGHGPPASASSTRPSCAKNGGTTFSHDRLPDDRDAPDAGQVPAAHLHRRPGQRMPCASSTDFAQARSAAGPPGSA